MRSGVEAEADLSRAGGPRAAKARGTTGRNRALGDLLAVCDKKSPTGRDDAIAPRRAPARCPFGRSSCTCRHAPSAISAASAAVAFTAFTAVSMPSATQHSATKADGWRRSGVRRGSRPQSLSAAALWTNRLPSIPSAARSPPPRRCATALAALVRAPRRGSACTDHRTLFPADCTRSPAIPVTRSGPHARRTSAAPLSQMRAAALRQAEYSASQSDAPSVPPDSTRQRTRVRLPDSADGIGSPQPEVNIRVELFTVDFLWRCLAPHRGGRSAGNPRTRLRSRLIEPGTPG